MKQRILTGVIAIILFLPFVIYGDLPFTVVVYLLATIGLYELLKMHKITWYSAPGLMAILLLWLVLYPATKGNLPFTSNTAQIILVFFLLLLAYTVLLKNKFTFDDVGFVLLAVLYVGMGFFYFIETRNGSDDGLAQVFFALLLIWSTDTGAYFTGRAFGKNKLWPEISPNKTIEGAIGGVAVATMVGIIFHLFYQFPYSLITIIVVSILVSVFGQIGDLVESAFKRHYNVKDSGNILPGHGGILDRFDSAIFVFPVLHLILQLVS